MSSSPTDLVTTLVDVLMPKMGSSVVEGTLVAWQVALGDAVAADQALCVISTDKVDSDCPSPASGTLAEILVAEGETVDVGTVIARVAAGDRVAAADSVGRGAPDDSRAADGGGAVVVGGGGVAASDRTGSVSGSPALFGTTRHAPSPTSGDTPARGTRPGPASSPATGALPSVASAPANGASAAPTRREALRRSSPVAAKIAAEHGIDVLALRGSGRNGRVTKADVLREVERPGSAPTTPAEDVDVAIEPPMHIESPYRRDPSVPVEGSTADGGPGSTPGRGPNGGLASSPRLSEHSRRASADESDEGTVVPLDRMRTAIGAQMRRALDTAAHATTIVECDMSQIERERRELGSTALPLVARHVLDALRDFPALNATFDGQTLTRFDRVHLGVAVALGDDGLIVPVIHDAQDLAPAGLATRIRDIAGRARTGELTADDVRGGTFTITNPGAAGALVATPIINVPQVAILDLEAIVKRPVVVTDADGQDSIAIRPMTHLCMSWDHRVLDGMYAARFLTALRRRIEGR